MTNTKWKWITQVDSIGYCLIRVVGDKTYTIYESRPGVVRFNVKTPRSPVSVIHPRNYKSFSSAQRAVRKLIEKERSDLAGKHSSGVTNESTCNIPEPKPSLKSNLLYWVKGVPQAPGNYLIYNSYGEKHSILLYDDEWYNVIGTTYKYRLSQSAITHYISLDNINVPWQT